MIELKNVTKSYGDKLLFENLSLSIPPGAIVGIIGPNGAGKSTLFRMITGEEKPDSGEIEIGSTVKLAYVNQSRELDGNKTVFEEISDGSDMITVGNFTTPIVAALISKGRISKNSLKTCPVVSGTACIWQNY